MATAIAVAGRLLSGSQDWCGSLQCGGDDIERRLYVGRAAELHFHLTPLALDFDSLFLDELSMFFKLRAK